MAAETDCPPSVIEVRRNEDGSLDEIVAQGCDVHIEEMGDGQWWMAISKDGYRQVVNFRVRKGYMMSEMDDWPEQKFIEADRDLTTHASVRFFERELTAEEVRDQYERESLASR